jgi:hypothetical protein
MKSDLKKKIMLTEHVLEVRHEASGSFLDVRGHVADYIKKSTDFNHWNIDSNIIRFRDEPDHIKSEGAFAGYKNAGYIALNPKTHNYFVDRAIKFWRTLSSNKLYEIPSGKRFGARTKIFMPSDAMFDEVKSLVLSKLFSENVNKIFKNTDKDLQLVLEYVDDPFDCRLRLAPVEEGEVENYMSFESDDLKKCGLYLDMDYYKEEEFTASDVPDYLKTSIELTWTKVEDIAKLIVLNNS